MSSDEFKKIVEAFVKGIDVKKKLILKNTSINIKEETLKLNGIYCIKKNIVEIGRPKTNGVNIFYIIEGYSPETDEIIIWLQK